MFILFGIGLALIIGSSDGLDLNGINIIDFRSGACHTTEECKTVQRIKRAKFENDKMRYMSENNLTAEDIKEMRRKEKEDVCSRDPKAVICD